MMIFYWAKFKFCFKQIWNRLKKHAYGIYIYDVDVETNAEWDTFHDIINIINNNHFQYYQFMVIKKKN